ncbi:DNA excision repair protein ERCC-6-like protein [Thelohanellus kitauei]|uniref:DNA excision repair protein ERCC-6-like protein n=1 Tax=Thelohanellus kitauei TaxID=669202 RepID=A0A0C2M6M3_THEKT|nr:DNA excision repair protein ERCC-6-like protein [Thelohanellus kitauei]
MKYLKLDGTITSIAARQKIINDFQSDMSIKIILITTQTGGVGLNLTAANRVILIEPTWNPGTDAQAIDRACRIGQLQHVYVYRIVTCGTVEEKIYRRQIFKSSLVKFAINEDKDPKKYFSKEELKELMTLSATNFSETCDMIHTIHGNPIKNHEEVKKLLNEGAYSVSDNDQLFRISENSLNESDNNPKTEVKHESPNTREVRTDLTEFNVVEFLKEIHESIPETFIEDDEIVLDSYDNDDIIDSRDIIEENPVEKCHHFLQAEKHGFIITKCRCDAMSIDLEKYNTSVNLGLSCLSDPEKSLTHFLDALDIFDDDISIQIQARQIAKKLGLENNSLTLPDYVETV